MSMKLMVAARRKPGMFRQDYATYLKTIHATIIVSGPADFLALHLGYRQNHVLDGAYGSAPTAEYDSVSELWFDGPAGMKAATQHPYYKSDVAPDEIQFGNQSNLTVMLTSEEVLYEQPAAESAVKIMHFVYRPTDGESDQFIARLQEAVAEAIGQDHFAGVISKAVLSKPLPLPPGASGDFAGGTPPNQCNGVISLSLLRGQESHAAKLCKALDDGLGDIRDSDRSFALVVDEVPIIARKSDTD